MINNFKESIDKSRRRFLGAVIAGAVTIGAGVIGYELGREFIKCPSCPPCPATSSAECSCPACPPQSIPQGFDYIVFPSNGNYNVMNSSGSVIYQSSNPGGAINYVVSQLSGKGGRVLIRSGVYTCSSYPCVTINNTSSSGTPGLLIIEGEDPVGVIFTVGNGVASSSSQGGLIVISGEFVWLRRLSINGNLGSNAYSVGNQFNVLVNNASHVWIDTIYSSNGPGAVGVLNSSSIVVSNVTSDGDAVGAYVGNSNTVLISYSSFRNSANYGVGIYSSSTVAVSNISIIDAQTGVLINSSDALIDSGTIDFVNVSGNYGINVTIKTSGYEVIIMNTVIRGSVANTIAAVINMQGRLGIENSIIVGGSLSTLNISSTPGLGAELVIINTQFTDKNTTTSSYPYTVSGVDSIELINNAFIFGNAASNMNGLNIGNAKYLVLRGNLINGYSTGININNCDSAYMYDNYFSNVATPVNYSNVSLMYAVRNIGWIPTVTTPLMPGSGTTTTNNYPVPVTVCLYGGSVTQVTVTKGNQSITAFQSLTGQAINGECFILDPGDSITVMYTQPPNWAWIPLTS